MSTGTRRRAAILQKVVHFLTAFSVTMKAIAKLEHPEGYWPVILFFFAAALYIVTITILHDRLHRHERLLTASVYALESLVTATVATLYWKENRAGLQYAFAISSVMFAAALIVHLLRHGGRGNASHPPEVTGA